MKNLKKFMTLGIALCMVLGMVLTATGCGKAADGEYIPEVTKATLKGNGAGSSGEVTVTLDVDLETMKAQLAVEMGIDVGGGYIMNFVVATSVKPEDADPMTYSMCTTLGEGTIAKTDEKGVYTATFTYQYAETDETLTATGKMLDSTTTITFSYADGVYTATLPSMLEGDTTMGIIGAYYNQAMTVSSTK